MNDIEIRMPAALARHFLTLAEQIGDRYSAAGCNDFPIDDTPENRLISEMCEAENLGMGLQEYQQSEHYEKPTPHNGKLYAIDFVIFDLFKAYVEGALE